MLLSPRIIYSISSVEYFLMKEATKHASHEIFRHKLTLNSFQNNQPATLPRHINRQQAQLDRLEVSLRIVWFWGLFGFDMGGPSLCKKDEVLVQPTN